MPSQQQFLYLSTADVAAVRLDPATARDAVVAAFADARNASLPKQALDIGAGHAFQAMVASCAADHVAAVKWLGMADGGLHALVCLNDLTTGAPLSVMDGDLITRIRTAAMSTTAALFLAPPQPRVLGFVGCGAQAMAHLTAFRAFNPSLARVVLHGRGESSAAALAAEAGRLGLTAQVTSAQSVVRQSDILVTTVPASADLVPFLDPSWLKPGAFVTAVDLGRSWIPSRLRLFDVAATDSLSQADALPGMVGNLPRGTFDHDLATLTRGESVAARSGRALFSFKGFASADLAIANLVYGRALSLGLGVWLDR